MGYVNELRNGLSGGRGPLSAPISTRYDGAGVNAAKYGGKETEAGESNYASNTRGIAGNGNV